MHSTRTYSPAHRPLLLAALTASALLTASACSKSASPDAKPSSPGSPPTAGSASPGGPAGAQQNAVPVESNPPGDIPDNLAFVPYTNAAGHYSFTYPEGWARSEAGSQVTFSDKLNGIQADVTSMRPIDVETAKRVQVPVLQNTEPAFELVSVKATDVPAGGGVKIVFRRNSPADPVTGRQYRDEVEEYLIGRGATGVRLDLYGPVGADNVDAYRTISRSLAFS